MATINPIILRKTTAEVGKNRVRFFDIDGTILKTQFVNDGENATAPPIPTQDLLTFDEWNNDFTNVNRNVDVGAIYKTTSGDTYIFARYNNVLGYQPELDLRKFSDDELSVDWGDGSPVQTTIVSGNISILKTAPYATAGDYLIKISCDGGWSGRTGGPPTPYRLFKGTYNYSILKLYMGNTMGFNSYCFEDARAMSIISVRKGVDLPSYGFRRCYSLQTLNLPSTVTTYHMYSLHLMYSLRILTKPDNLFNSTGSHLLRHSKLRDFYIPDGVTNLFGYMFQDNTNLQNIRIPESLTSTISPYTFDNCASLLSASLENTSGFNTNAFSACRSLTEFVIGYRVNSFGTSSAFAGCISLKKIIILKVEVPTLSNTNTFSINAACKMYIPDASLDNYKAASNWVTFANYMYPISELEEYNGTIFFNTNGGSFIKQIQGDVGTVATEPTAPTKSGETFDGWYKDELLTDVWNWATDVFPATNITLYAKWQV